VLVKSRCSKTGKTDLAENLALILAEHPDLALIIEHWPELPEHIRAAIRLLIEGG